VQLLIAPAVAGFLAYAFGREEDIVRRQAALLDMARIKFTSLAHAAISEGEWEVSLHDANLPTCWEENDCEEDECPVYGKHNMRCWLVTGTLCFGEPQGRFAGKMNDCIACDIYQKTVGVDPINEINETFNSLIWALAEKEGLLAAANQELMLKYKELEVQQEKTRIAAQTDALTGLKNFGHFRHYLKKSLYRAKRYGKSLSLILMDLEQFKSINKEFGFRKGDRVLKAVGRILCREIGDKDYIARYGGEEFVVIMPDATGPEAVKMAEKLKGFISQVAEEVHVPEKYLIANFGVADMPDCAVDGASLISAADTALLLAGNKGANGVAYFRDMSDAELKNGDVERVGSRLDGAGFQTLSALADAVNATDKYVGGVSEDLPILAISLARDLGMGDEQAKALELATRLHDIGKIGVPGSILRKTSKLSPEEQTLVEQHPEIGQRLLEEAQQIKELISAILYHHERWDGKGYPEKLRGEEIPLMARVVGIFDAYRAMRCDRPYRRALSKQAALAELRKGAGTQFDPNLVEKFLDLIENDRCNLELKAG
jgi:diguanylate cyclase (GGDEF)-like protein